MRTVEITRAANTPVLDQLAEMRAWLRETGIQAIALEATGIRGGHVSYRASFATVEDAERFCVRFGPDEAADPP